MRNRYYALLLVAALTALPACTVFQWGGPAKGTKESAAAAAADQPENIFKQGESLLAKGKYDEARKKYSEIRAHDPEKYYDALVQVRLGDSYYEEARYAEAEVEYNRFLELHPKNKAAPYVLYQVGMCNFKQIDLPDRDPSFAMNSVTDFQKLLSDFPGNPYEDEAKEKLRLAKADLAQHEFIVGSYYYKKDSYKAAAKRFKGIIDKYPGSKDEPKVLYFLTDSYIRMGDFDDAKNTLAVLYQQYPNNQFAEKAKKKLAEKIPQK
jgi:outer membrane protein assembly factor BamD